MRTVNHRLGVLGYLNLAEVGGAIYASAANAGQLDLASALEWMPDNIANFGGDPGNVTISTAARHTFPASALRGCGLRHPLASCSG